MLSKMSTTLSSFVRLICLYFEYYQLPLIFIIIPFFCHFNNERFFDAVVGMKLQFSEKKKYKNHHQDAKIQLNGSAEFLFSFAFHSVF